MINAKVGMRMGFLKVLLTAVLAVLFVAPAFAETPTSMGQVVILGGIDDGEPKKSRSVSFSEVPDDLRSRTISFQTALAPGSILVRTSTRRLYFVLPAGEAIEYKVGVGREGYTWSGTNQITSKAEWPDWRPPREMIEREASLGNRLPEFMPGGPDNPLGARALYIGNTQYRIHGTTAPWSIGRAVSSGCIRMMNEEVIDLYNRVEIGATVVVEN